MKKLKLKILSFVLCIMMCFSFVGCGGGNNDNDNGNGGNNGGENGGNPPTKEEQVLAQVKESFINEKDCEITIENNTTTSIVKMKYLDTCLYVSTGINDEIVTKTYEKNNNSYLVKVYDLEDKTYISESLSKENYYYELYNNFSVIDWLDFYNNYLKNDNSTITLSENNETNTIVLTSKTEFKKDVITLTISNKKLNTIIVERFNVYQDIETLARTITASFDYSVNIDFNLNDYNIYAELEDANKLEELLTNCKNSFITAGSFSTTSYMLSGGNEIELETNSILLNSEKAQTLSIGKGLVVYVEKNQGNEALKREYNTEEMFYNESSMYLTDYYNFLNMYYSVIDWVDYINYMDNDMGYNFEYKILKLNNSKFDYKLNLLFTYENSDVFVEFNLFVKDNKVLQLEKEYKTDWMVESEYLFAKYTYNVDTTGLEINHDDFTLI